MKNGWQSFSTAHIIEKSFWRADSKKQQMLKGEKNKKKDVVFLLADRLGMRCPFKLAN